MLKKAVVLLKTLFYIFLVLVAGRIAFFQVKTKVTDNTGTYIYDLPFETGTKRQVMQGYGGLFSHRHIAAIDFSMPVGTPVCAAREGVVLAYRDDSNEGGIWGRYKNKANFIIIKHDDGTMGCYWHLQQNGVLVKSGRVSKGQVIGLSGATGQVIRPHLHFSVKRVLNYDPDSFVKTKFRTHKGIVFLRAGAAYTKP